MHFFRRVTCKQYGMSSYISIQLPINPSTQTHTPVYPSICLSMCTSTYLLNHRSVYLAICTSLQVSIYLSVCQCLSTYPLTLCQSMYLYIYLSLFPLFYQRYEDRLLRLCANTLTCLIHSEMYEKDRLITAPYE